GRIRGLPSDGGDSRGLGSGPRSGEREPLRGDPRGSRAGRRRPRVDPQESRGAQVLMTGPGGIRIALASMALAAFAAGAPGTALAEAGGGGYVPGTSGLTLPSLNLSFANTDRPQDLVSVLRIVVMLTVLSLAPAILIM